VFLYNLLNLKRTIWSGPELSAGKHTIVFDFKPDGPGLGKGGTGVLGRSNTGFVFQKIPPAVPSDASLGKSAPLAFSGLTV
jgi:hypothetical protein